LPPALQINVLKSAIATASDLTILTDIIRGIIGDINPDGAKASRNNFNFGEEETIIRNLLLDRVRVAARTGDIWNQANPGHLLWFWLGSNEANEVKTFTDNAMTSSVGLKNLLEIMISTVRSTAGDYEHIQRSWEKIVDLNALRKYAAELVKTANSDDEVSLARRFLSALDKGQSGSF
jgi:hypothetical protein